MRRRESTSRREWTTYLLLGRLLHQVREAPAQRLGQRLVHQLGVAVEQCVDEPQQRVAQRRVLVRPGRAAVLAALATRDLLIRELLNGNAPHHR